MEVSVSYFVLYQGTSSDGPAFIHHYKNCHLKILERFPAIKHVSMHCPVQWHDPSGVNEGAFSLIVQMEFADIDALEFALRSMARKDARRDMEEHFPKFNGIVFHQATSTKRTEDDAIKN